MKKFLLVVYTIFTGFLYLTYNQHHPARNSTINYKPDFKDIYINKPVDFTRICETRYVYGEKVSCRYKNIYISISILTSRIDSAIIKSHGITIGEYIIQYGRPTSYLRSKGTSYLYWNDGLLIIVEDEHFSPASYITQFRLTTDVEPIFNNTWKGFKNN